VKKVNDSLGLLEYYLKGEASVCGVWTRKDGANELFTEIYTVKVEGRVLGFRNNGDVVIEVVDDDHFGDSEIKVYEPSSGHINGVGINGKRDIVKARQELQRLGIQSGLWLGQTKNGKYLKPQAAYSFTPENQKKFCEFIKGVKLPDGFGSCFKNKVTDNDTNITGLKSHDCHIMMQRLLSYGLQNYLPDKIAKPIIELCSLFKQICSVTLMEDDMSKAQIKVVDILCDLELIYPPALFDIMVYLVIHLPLEALEGGPIRPRLFPNKDMKEEFPDWFGSQIRQRHVENDKDPEVSITSELFALAYGQKLNIPKLQDAKLADTPYSQHCTLILTKGDFATDFVMSRLSVMGQDKDKYGVFPLEGKLLNVREASPQELEKNTDIQNIKKILGLQDGLPI
nr:hypothetical protein [Tanacetum cinerariifolium]